MPARFSFWLEGLVRAVMELEGLDAQGAEELLRRATDDGMSVAEFYGRMQQTLGDRLLVDKTPAYALDLEVLRHSEQSFDSPRFIHLVRHPYGMIRSFEKARLEQVFFRHPHDFGRRQLAELIWTVCQENILTFLDEIPAERRHRLDFEDLVRRPRSVLEELCAFLDVDFHPAMLEPYAESGARMTDGIHALSKMVGDVKFHEHRAIDPAVAESWRRDVDRDFLGEPTWRMASSLGIRQRAVEPRCLVGLQPGKSGRVPLFVVHPVFGEVQLFRHLAEALGRQQPVYGLRALGLEAGEQPLDDIGAMAERYLEDVVARWQGPYALAGSSMGGVVAWEMARQLRERGEEVMLLAFLDTADPRTALPPADDLEIEAEMLVYLAGDGFREAALERLVESETQDERLDFILDTGRASGHAPAGADRAWLRRILDVVRRHGDALRAYRPQSYDGALLHLRAAQTAARLEDPNRSGWSAWCRSVEVKIMPGDHHSMHFPPQVTHVAKGMCSALVPIRYP